MPRSEQVLILPKNSLKQNRNKSEHFHLKKLWSILSFSLRKVVSPVRQSWSHRASRSLCSVKKSTPTHSPEVWSILSHQMEMESVKRLQNRVFEANVGLFSIEKVDFSRFLVVWRAEKEFRVNFGSILMDFSSPKSTSDPCRPPKTSWVRVPLLWRSKRSVRYPKCPRGWLP